MKACFEITVIIFCIEILSLVSTVDYCAANICNGSKLHTLCQYKEDGPASHCQKYEKTINTQRNKEAILDKLNTRRNMIARSEVRSYPSAANMRKLIWSDQLSILAQRWADQCVNEEKFNMEDDCRDLVNRTAGQNIATVMGDSPGLTPASLVDVWYMELLNINSSIIASYRSLTTRKGVHHAYFTQLVWAESTHVGCGGVKFTENYKQFEATKTRTVNRLVCNFSPKGNIEGKPVYEVGKPCSNCLENSYCDDKYESLCHTGRMADEEISDSSEATSTALPDISATTAVNIDIFDMMAQDKYPHIFDLTSNIDFHKLVNNYETNTNIKLKEFNHVTATYFTSKATDKICYNHTLIEELLYLLKNKFNYELSDLNKIASTKNFQETINDVAVEDFIQKLYNNKKTTTTERTTENDILNSTSLVNLVEAVIFRNTDKVMPTEVEKSIEISTQVTPVKIKHLLAESETITPNNGFDGHYFFPEEDDEKDSENNNSATNVDTYYDTLSSLAPSDILAEIKNIKSKSENSDFLDDILDYEEMLEVTTRSSTIIISPDDMGLIKDGYYNMKRFLDEIGGKKGR